MNLETYLKNAVANLSVAGIPTARLDALILLEDVTGKDRSWLLAHPEFELDYTVIKTLEKQIERRAKHEPLSYIRGKSFMDVIFLLRPILCNPVPKLKQ